MGIRIDFEITSDEVEFEDLNEFSKVQDETVVGDYRLEFDKSILSMHPKNFEGEFKLELALYDAIHHGKPALGLVLKKFNKENKTWDDLDWIRVDYQNSKKELLEEIMRRATYLFGKTKTETEKELIIYVSEIHIDKEDRIEITDMEVILLESQINGVDKKIIDETIKEAISEKIDVNINAIKSIEYETQTKRS